MNKILLVLCCLLPGLAQAGNCCGSNVNYEEDSQYYMGAELNQAKPAAVNSVLGTSLATRLFYGYRMTDHVAIEFAYIGLGSYSDQITGRAVDVTGEAISLFAKFPLDSDYKYSLYGRIGVAFANVAIAGVGRARHSDLTLGAGIEINLDEEDHAWYLRAGVDRYNTGCLSVVVPPNVATPDSIMTAGAALIYNFK